MGSPANNTSRSSRVLDPDFVKDLEALSIDEVRRRRDEALAEREFLSYLRRLVQVRQDLLAAERHRRRSGSAQEPLVDRLTAVLSEGSRAGSSRGEALAMRLSEADLGEAEGRADAILGAAALSPPEDLDDEELEQSLQTLEREERRISADRTAVFHVHDRLQDELKRRYREDPSSIPTEP